MNTTASDITCRVCGARLPSGPLTGLCPACLLDSTLDVRSTPADALDDFQSPAAGMPWRFGQYEVLAEIARGGAGVVFRARDEGLRREVALKFLRAGPLASRDDTRRLFLEARAAARLQHPNIVPVFEVGGADDARPFLAMAFLPGGTLAERLQRGPVPHREAARWIAAVARAVHHAHQHGILHRDLKPGNILFDAADEPRVTDFGLARLLDEDHTLTRTDVVLGTPTYLAPEQAAGHSGEVSTAADIHALGGILYETLTGRPPFTGENLPALLRQVAEAPPIPPSQLNPRIPHDLETICLKCLEKEPARRYLSAQELADELDRFLKDEPIHARPISRAERTWRWCRRKPALAGALAAAVLFLIAGLAGVLWQWRAAQSHATAATQAATRAEANALTARRAQYASDMNLAHQAVQDGDFFRARQLLERYRRQEPGVRSQEPETRSEKLEGARSDGQSILTPDSRLLTSASPDLRGWEWRYLESQTRRDDLGLLGQHTNLVFGLAISPDGLRAVSVDFGGLLSVWNLASRILILNRQFRAANFAEHDQLFAVTYSPDGRQIAVGGVHGRIYQLDAATLEDVSVFPSQMRVMTLAYSPNGELLAAACTQGLQIWNVATRRKLAEFPSNHDLYEPLGLRFSPDGRILASSQDRLSVRLYDTTSWREIRVLEQGSPMKRPLAFSPDGRWFASSGTNLKVWNTRDWTLASTWTNQVSWASALAFSPDGNYLVHAGADQQIHISNTSNWTGQASLKGDINYIEAMVFTPDNSSFITASERSLHIWPSHKLPEPQNHVAFPTDASRYWRLISLSPDAHSVVVGMTNSAFEVWDIDTFKPVGRHTLAPGESFVRNSQVDMISGRAAELPPFYCAMAIDSARRWVALGDVNGWLAWRSLDGSALNRMVRAHPGVVAMMAFSPDGRQLATAGWDGTLKLHDVRTGELVLQHPGPVNAVMSLVFSPDSKWLAAGGWDGGLLVWRPNGTNLSPVLKPGGSAIRWLSFAPDNSRLYTSGYDKRIQVWRMPEAQLEREIPVRDYANLALSPDGGRLVLAQARQIRVLETRDWQDVATLNVPDEMGHATAFQSDGATLLKLSSESIRVWRATAVQDGL